MSGNTWTEIRVVLDGPYRRLAVGRFLDSLGSGLTMSLLVVYLVDVRHIDIFIASLVLTWMAVIGFVVTPVMGTATDRWGPRRVLLAGVALEACGVALTGFVTTAPMAFAVASIVAFGASGVWGPLNTFTAQIVPEEKRTTAFAISFMLLNLGLGLGGLMAAFIVNIEQPGTFQLLYFIDALTYVFLWIAVVTMKGLGGPVSTAATRSEGEGWGVALRDSRLVGLIIVSLALVMLGYGSMEAGLSLFITNVAGESPKLIGVVFLANTLVIVICQLFVLAWIKGRSRVRMIGLAGFLWGIAWLLIVPTGVVSPAVAVVLFIGFAAVFAVGESVWSPTVPALVNAIAPDHLRGRYNSAQSLTWTLGSMFAPIFSGLLIAAGRGVLWAAIVGLGCLVAALAAQRLRTRLTPTEDGRVS